MTALSLLRNRHRIRATRFGILALLITIAAFSLWKSRHDAKRCRENLRQIHEALLKYERKHDALPELAFYPNDSRLDPESLYTVLAPFGVHPEACMCPASPPVVRETGISYLWNVKLNDVNLYDLSPPVWMLVEIHALSQSVPAPHRGAYHVLYSDGTVTASRSPPYMP